MPTFGGKRFVSWRLGMMLVLLAGCFFWGGASRVDVLSLVGLQPLAVVCTAFFLLTSPSLRWDSIRIPLLLLLALGMIMVVQLIPLPPELWRELPGHGQFARSAEVAGMAQPWRPISVTPDLTLASLVSLCVPVAALVGFASLTVEQTRGLLSFLIIGVTVSAVVGLAQVADGGTESLYLYEITNLGSPVGLFANRNHQAVALVMAWPMLALWAGYTVASPGPRDPSIRSLIALATGIFYLPLILAIGSRAGLALGLIALTVAFFLWRARGQSLGLGRRTRILIGTGAAVGVLTVVGLALAFSRDEAIQRLAGTSSSDEVRLEYLPTVLHIIRDFAPVGAGFGSFDPVFRIYEPIELLNPQYLNHAHNDLLELALSGGLPALVVLASFLGWLGLAALRALRQRGPSTSLAFARLGLGMILILSLSSLVDYPLRTPLLAALFAIACGWVSDYVAGSNEPVPRMRPETALPDGTE
jgi:O-antigen ligase